jgi:hypothetical protein
MRRRFLASWALGVVAFAAMPGQAIASGPAAHGKEVIHLTCEGLGEVAVSVPPGEKNNGAGQIVGAKGHGILVASSFTVTDLTKSTVLFSEPFEVGGGHAHRNQPMTMCSGVVFEAAPASEFFEGGPLPEGVEPTDIIQGSLVAQVVIKQ